MTLRSRAEESLKWLNEGAVLKPEQIKIKTVSIDDINYLGYREGDLGRVVIRRPSSKAELARSLRAEGFGPQDPEWATAFKRLKDHATEFNHPAYDQGYVKYLEDGAANDELTLRWNLQANSVDAGVLPTATRSTRCDCSTRAAATGSWSSKSTGRGARSRVTSTSCRSRTRTAPLSA